MTTTNDPLLPDFKAKVLGIGTVKPPGEQAPAKPRRKGGGRRNRQGRRNANPAPAGEQ